MFDWVQLVRSTDFADGQFASDPLRHFEDFSVAVRLLWLQADVVRRALTRRARAAGLDCSQFSRPARHLRGAEDGATFAIARPLVRAPRVSTTPVPGLELPRVTAKRNGDSSPVALEPGVRMTSGQPAPRNYRVGRDKERAAFRGNRGPPRHRPRCCIIGKAATRSPLPVQFAAGCKQKSGRTSRSPLAWLLARFVFGGERIRAMVGDVSMSGDDAASCWIGAVEADQVAALRAFRRPPSDIDRGLVTEPSAASGLPPGMNLKLARRVYAGPEGTIDVVPGPGLIGCVVRVAGTGERISGSTTTELVARGTHGFISGGADRPRTFRGVLGAEVHDLRVITADGLTEMVPVNADDGYWTTIGDPFKAVLSLIDGSEREILLFGIGSDRRRGQP